MLKKIYWFGLTFLCIFLSPLKAQESKFEDLVAVYLYRFIDFTVWPNEFELEHFQLVYLGNNPSLYDSLNNLVNRPVRGKSIKIRQVSRSDDVIPSQVVLVDESSLSSLRAVNALIGREPILVVSVNAQDKQLIGINLVQSGQNLRFEVNRHNLIYQNLQVNKDIVLSGGTELDVAELLKDMELDLQKSRQRLSGIMEQLEDSETRLTQQQAQINEKQAEYDDIEQKYRLQQRETQRVREQFTEASQALAKTQEELSNSSQQLAVQQQNFEEKNSELDLLSQQIAEKQRQVDEQEQKITVQTNNLIALETSLETSRQKLDAQTSTITELDEKVGVQSFLLVLMLGLFVSVCLTVVVIMRWARQKAQLSEKLTKTVSELDSANKRLMSTQEQLVDSEKLAALGGIVAGVAHEINTPIGIAVTSSSLVADKLKEIREMLDSGTISRAKVTKLMEEMHESTILLCNNIERAKSLIFSFKQVSADQISEGKRSFNLATYLDEICRNLNHLLKKGRHHIEITCPQDLSMNSYPGALSQVMTNLVVNSVEHGFEGMQEGVIEIAISHEEETIQIEYKDNGKGIPAENSKKIFEPFFTTGRGKGNTGLGMHICHNLVYQKLGGTINCQDTTPGVLFVLQLPQEVLVPGS